MASTGVWAQTPAADSLRRERLLETVVVTGTGTQNALKNTPIETEVISGKMLRQYAGQSIEDILGSLSSSIDFGENDMGSHIQMNGLGNGYILILIDGKRIHGDNGGENDLGLIDPQNIDRIEIVKGASSALYGSDAIAGVINIITKKHTEAVLLNNSTRVGSYGDVRQHNSVGLSFGKWASLTRFQLQHSDGWQNTSVEDPSQTEFLITDSRNKTVNRYTNYQLAERLTYALNPAVELYADGSLYWKRIYRPSGKYAQSDVKTYDMEYQNASVSGGGKWKINKDDFVTLDVDWNRHAYYYNFTDTTLVDGYVNGRFTPYFPYFPGQKDLQSDQQRTMANLKGVFLLPEFNRLSVGAEWRYDWLDAPMRVAGGRATDNTEALFIQDEWNKLKWLQLTGGMRLTRNEQFGTKLTPKLSAMLSLGDFRIRTTWSKGFKTPTPKELHYRYVRDMNGTYLYLGNTDLKPQRSDYFSLNGEYRTGRLSISATPYYNKVRDMIALVTIPTTAAPGDLIVTYDPVKVRQYKNLEQAKTYGVDVTARYAVGEWSMGGGYSYLDTEAEQYDSNHERMRRVIIDGMAHHKANVFLNWNHSFTRAYKLGVGLFGRMSTKRYYQINGNGKGYQLWRLTTSHTFLRGKHTTYALDAGVDNIFNYCDRTYHGLHLGTTSPGRTVYATFNIKFSKGKKFNNNNTNFKSNQDEED
ncbi:MAG: TonB-dependent receptor [Bacteroidaceae bacterium]|nr:TonB-dependent receptor [Bacteroidaceae bacterium]